MAQIMAMGKAPRDPDFLSRNVSRYFEERCKDWPEGEHILVGRTPCDDSIRLQSNDYLHLAHHPEVVRHLETVGKRVEKEDVKAAVFLHGDNPQGRFEQRMASLIGCESAVLCQSGWNANVGLLQSMVQPGVPVYLDLKAHMSLWEGARVAGAICIPFLHNSPESLQRKIKTNGPGFVIVDSVYSTSGSVAPLKAIVGVAHEHDCVMVVDESHSLGTHGRFGSGLVHGLGLNDKVHFITASLAKAFASRGGIIGCTARNAEYVKYHSLPSIFSSGLLHQEIDRLDMIRRIIVAADDRRLMLQLRAQYLRAGLLDLGYPVRDSASQIISLEAGEEWRCIALRNALEKRGVFGSVFCAPATGKCEALVRFTLHSDLTFEQLNEVLRVCRNIRKEVNLSDWPIVRRHSRRERAATNKVGSARLKRDRSLAIPAGIALGVDTHLAAAG